MRHRPSSIVFTLFFVANCLSAQSLGSFDPSGNIEPSAETFAMNKYGKLSPAMYTGAMSYTLPVFTYKDPEFTIPINLVYHFDGYRPAEHSGVVGYKYRGNFLYAVDASGNEQLESIGCDESRVVAVYSNTGVPSYKDYWMVRDHLGSVRAVYDLSTSGTIGSKKKELSDFQPFGTRIARSSTSYNHWRFSGKEEQMVNGTDIGLLDFGARYYDPWLSRWTTQDPLAHKYAGINPYVYCNGDPVNMVDVEGISPIYSQFGLFLGTDDQGLQGDFIIMEKSLFEQGMSHDKAVNNAFTGDISSMAKKLINAHYDKLPGRPDYDGIVTIEEGILWAKQHKGALDYPSPDNTLYFDVSKLDFGRLGVQNSGLSENVPQVINLLDYVDLNKPSSVRTVYALGNTKMNLINKEAGKVELFSDNYDWDYHNNLKFGFLPQGRRDILVFLERKRIGVNDKHGFPIRFYGQGTLKP